MRRGGGPGLAVGIRLSADETLPEGRHAPETAAILRTLAGEGLIDYASAVIGDSASYVGAAWIVPPPPVARDCIHGARGDPARAAERAADRHLAHPRAGRGRGAAGRRRRRRRRHDARADRRSRPAPAHHRGPRGRAHPVHRLQPGLHRPLPPRHADLVPPESPHGTRAHARRARRRRPGRSVLVVGGGPAGLAAAVAAGTRGRARHAGRGGRRAGRPVRARGPSARASRDGAPLPGRLDAPARGRGRGRPSRHAPRRRFRARARRRSRDRRDGSRSPTAPRSPRRPASR